MSKVVPVSTSLSTTIKRLDRNHSDLG